MNEVTFVINEKKIKENIDNLHKGNNCRIMYTVKANDSLEVLSVIEKYLHETDGYQVNSLSEFYRLKTLGITPDRIMHINILSDNSVRVELYQNGVRRFVFGSCDSLVEFDEMTSNLKDFDGCEYCLRECVADVCTSVGLTGASPLGLVAEDFIRASCYFNNIIRERNYNSSLSSELYVNEDLLNRGKDKLLEAVFNKVESLSFLTNRVYLGGSSLVSKLNSDSLNSLSIEVGTAILKDAISLETEVIATNKNCGQLNIYLGVGLYTGCLDAITHNREFDVTLYSGCLPNIEDNMRIGLRYEKYGYVKLWGCSCDTCDFIGSYYLVPKNQDLVTKGCKVVIKDVGAYFSIFNMGYATDIKYNYRRM